VRFRFKTSKLQALYTSERDAHKYPPEVVDAFFKVMARIRAASDERDLYALKALRYEKLSGSWAGYRSLRLNRQWRLVVSSDEDEEGRYLLIESIVDYH
jgi:proteic killer suppression protein